MRVHVTDLAGLKAGFTTFNRDASVNQCGDAVVLITG